MDVRLIPPAWATHLVGDWTDWLKRPLPVAELPTRYVLPDDAYVEYAWQDAGRAVRPDPANPVQADNPWWPAARALVGRDYAPHPLLAALTGIDGRLLPALDRLHAALGQKAAAFDDVVKIGRTHLMDATPIRLGQVFGGFQSQVEHAIRRVKHARPHLRELAIGGTAVGTGINTHPAFGARVAARVSELTGICFDEASNHVEAQAAQDAAVQASGALKAVAVALIRIANDIRHLGSGPRLGLGELRLPAVPPGSSIMPGKVNPVLAEALIMVGAQVIGNDAAITLGGVLGDFELNTMLPLIARNLLEQIALLAAGVDAFTEKLVKGLEADRAFIAGRVEQSLSLATALAPRIGYDAAAAIAKESVDSGRTVREIAAGRGVLPPEELEMILDLRRQTEPGL